MSYVFWCSNCKVSHAGVCQPLAQQSKADSDPKPGSTWHAEMQYRQDPWEDSIFVGDAYLEVVRYDRGRGIVICKQKNAVASGTVETEYDMPIDAWNEVGVVIDGKVGPFYSKGSDWRVRLVPRT